MLFHERYSRYHIGNLVDTPLKEIWNSDRYWEVMDLIASPRFDPRTMCGSLCLQHKVNEFLWSLRDEGVPVPEAAGEPPLHVNFI